jgi:hypothetical protein
MAGARTLHAEGPQTWVWYQGYVVLHLLLLFCLQALQLLYFKVGIPGNEVNI